MNKELQAAFDLLNQRLTSIEARLATLEQGTATQGQVEEVRRLANDTLAAAINAQ